jgi:cytochrome b subunit of formate dehydrogenase
MTDHVERYGRAARWFHAAVYLTVLALLVTGWWFLIDGYRHPLLGLPTDTHQVTGIVFALVVGAYVVARIRTAIGFLKESVGREPGDLRWLAAFPKAAFTGRFPRHDGFYDPGQRLANLVMVGTLGILILTGLAVLYVPMPMSLSLAVFKLHRWASWALTPVVLGHIVVASGMLPGYRGVWRSMHLGGRLPHAIAARIWPGWLARRADGPARRTSDARFPGSPGPDHDRGTRPADHLGSRSAVHRRGTRSGRGDAPR